MSRPEIADPGRRALLRVSATALLLVASRGSQGAAREGGTRVNLYADASLAKYGFPDGHPLGLDRQGAFLREAERQGLIGRAHLQGARAASREEIRRFHTTAHIDRVATAEAQGLALLDGGDTPVFPGVYPASATVVGAALDALERVMSGDARRSLQPIGGLHHAGRGHAAGFCVFNDLGVVIETLRQVHGVERIGYVDIDVHHGDGVFYAFESDPDLIFADIHQDGRTLYPGTGREHETGTGSARGTKLNIELAPGAGDAEFMRAWSRVEAHLERFRPEFILFQCGADGLAGDPLAALEYSPAVHAHAARRLCALAERFAKGRLMAFGGGGYHRPNLASAWSAVLRELLG
jgi:acetoin utilization protein AcuC